MVEAAEVCPNEGLSVCLPSWASIKYQSIFIYVPLQALLHGSVVTYRRFLVEQSWDEHFPKYLWKYKILCINDVFFPHHFCFLKEEEEEACTYDGLTKGFVSLISIELSWWGVCRLGCSEQCDASNQRWIEVKGSNRLQIRVWLSAHYDPGKHQFFLVWFMQVCYIWHLTSAKFTFSLTS